MSNKAKNIIIGAVAVANISTPVISLANGLDEVNSINESSNTLTARAVIQGNAIVTESVNFRNSASWSGTILQVINKGEPVFVVSTNNDWAKVNHDNITGYVPVKYLKAADNNKTVNESVNLRTTASWSGNILAVIKKGDLFNVVGTTGEWTKVQFKGLTGYIASKYVVDTNSSTDSDSKTVNKKVTGAVNLRSTPSWSSTVIHVINSGDTVSVYPTVSGDFTKVYHGGKVGYIPTSYLSGNSSTTTTPNTNTSTTPNINTNIEAMNKTGKVVNLKANDTLNVRALPDTSSTSLGKLAAGTTVQITGKDKISGWYQINYNGKVGYVGDYYIQITNTNASTSYTTKKTTTNLNMRTGPSASNTLITTIPSGATVKVMSTSNGWDYVEYDGKKGYCSNAYLTTVSQPTTIKKYTTTNLNMRSGPSTNHAIITTINTNTQVEVLSTDANGWSKIKYSGKEGYVNAKYLSDSQTSTTLPGAKPSYSRVKVVIDPGHGGTDPGAIGFGRKEKDIALNISKKINANLKTLGFQTIMTRSTDVYIPLAQRYQIANNNNADMFVSVHLNSASSSAYGIETLYKNSKTFASDIQNQMVSATGARDRGLKYRSDLAVLNGTKMTAALVETGFISYESESAKLATDSYQNTLANAIAKGIAKYTDSNISK